MPDFKNALKVGGVTIINGNGTFTDAEIAAIAALSSAADKAIYFTGSGAAALFDLTSQARQLLDDTSFSAMLTTLGAAPTHTTIWFDEATSNTTLTSGNNAHDALQNFSLQIYQLVAATNADYIEVPFRLAAGTYTFSVLGITENDAGIIDWSIDGSNVLTGQDWYSGTVTHNVVKTASVTVATSGNHTLRGTVNGKNGSSAGFYFVLTKAWFS